MTKTFIGLSLAALALAGAAYAQDHQMGDPMGGKTVTRAEAQAKAEERFAMMDVNKDGKLDAADREAHQTQMMTAMFDKVDANHDGTITKDEFMAAHKDGMGGMEHGMGGGGMGGHKGGGMGMMMMHMADTNKDSAISKDEFVAAQLAMFDKADANHDGKLTPDERKAAHAKMREHMKMGRGGHGAMDGHDMPPPPPPPPGH